MCISASIPGYTLVYGNSCYKWYEESVNWSEALVILKFTFNTLCVPMELSIKFDTVKSGWSIVYIEGSQVNIIS